MIVPEENSIAGVTLSAELICIAVTLSALSGTVPRKLIKNPQKINFIKL